MLAVIVVCISLGFLQRLLFPPISDEPHRKEAIHFAEGICGRITGQPATVTEIGSVTKLVGKRYSQTGQAFYRWEMTCAAGELAYQLQLCPQNRRVFLIRRLAAPSGAPNDANSRTGSGVDTAREAVWLASAYLRVIAPGAAAKGLVRVRKMSEDNRSFRWEFLLDGGGDRPLTHTLRLLIDSRDGTILHFVNGAR